MRAREAVPKHWIETSGFCTAAAKIVVLLQKAAYLESSFLTSTSKLLLLLSPKYWNVSYNDDVAVI